MVASGCTGNRPNGLSARLPPTPSPSTARPADNSCTVIIEMAVAAGWRAYGLVMPTASLIEVVRTAAPASTLNGSRAGPSSPNQISSSPRCSAYWRNSTICGAGAEGNNHTPVLGGTGCVDYTATQFGLERSSWAWRGFGPSRAKKLLG